MKLKYLLLAAFLAPFAYGQGTFQNLGFEAATVSPTPIGVSGGLVPVNQGMPSWTAYVGTTALTRVLHNDVTVGGSIVCILGPNYYSSMILDGNYTALLIAGTSPADVGLAQTGLVPADAQSLTFRALPVNGPFSVSLGGSLLPVIPLEVTPDYNLYGSDITAFAGQIAELRFTAVSMFAQGELPNVLYLDSISFSSLAVPEPSAWALVLGGLAGLGLLRWRPRIE